MKAKRIFTICVLALLMSCVSKSTYNETMLKLDSLQLAHSNLLDSLSRHSLNPNVLAKTAKDAKDVQNLTELVKIRDILTTYYPDDVNTPQVNHLAKELDSIIKVKNQRLVIKKSSVTGVVRYLYNDYVGYKPDLGTEVIAFKVNSNSTKALKYELYERYYIKAEYMFLYYGLVAKHGDVLSKESIRKKCNFTEEDEANVIKMSEDLGPLNIFAMKAKEDKSITYFETVVDATGSYKLSLPYGEYYFVFVSKNRSRPIVAELMHRVYINKVEVKKPNTIESYDFDL